MSDHINCLRCGARINSIDAPCPACGNDNRIQRALDAQECHSLQITFPEIFRSESPKLCRRGRGISLWMFRRNFRWLFFLREINGPWRQIDELAFDWAKFRCDWDAKCDPFCADQWRNMLIANADNPKVTEALETLKQRAYDEARLNDIGVDFDSLTEEARIAFASTCGSIASRDIGMNREELDNSKWVSPKLSMLALRDVRFPHCMLVKAMISKYFKSSVSMEGVPEAQRSPELYRALMCAKGRRMERIYLYIPPEDWHGKPTDSAIYWDYGLRRYMAVGRAPFELDGRTWYRPVTYYLEDPDPLNQPNA